MSFYPGQLVVALTTWDVEPGRIEEPPVRGTVYTVRDVGFDGNEPWIHVHELRNPAVYWGNLPEVREAGWGTQYFRPITETKLEIFRSLLNPTPEQRRQLERETA